MASDRTDLQIPAEAMPVVLVLRKDVVRPDPHELVTTRLFINKTRWGERCPMGLHPRSRNPAPDCKSQFPISKRITALSIESFYGWWDDLKLEDAKQAVDLIWPTIQKQNIEAGGSDGS